MAASPNLPGVSLKRIEKIAAQAKLTPAYIVLMSMAGILAAVALLANSVPMLIGSMVVAPALPPLALVAFAAVGGQPLYAVKGLWGAIVGILLAAGFAMATAWLLNTTNVFPEEANLLNKPLLEERVNPGWFSVVAALAAGIAGTIGMIEEKTDTLVGVVAALALVPAAAAASIALLSGDPIRSLGGMLLLAINITVIILTGIITLLVIRPDKA